MCIPAHTQLTGATVHAALAHQILHKLLRGLERGVGVVQLLLVVLQVVNSIEHERDARVECFVLCAVGKKTTQ